MAESSGNDVTETVVTQGYLARIPAQVRRKLDIQPGDVVAWSVERGAVKVRIRKRRRGGFSDFKPFDFGRATDATKDHDEAI